MDKRKPLHLILLLTLGLLASSVASASIIPTFVNESPAGGGLFNFTYNVTLNPLENLITGSQLCFADIAGLAGTPTGPAVWNASNLATSCPIPAGVTAPNAAPAVLFTYTGPTVLGSSNGGMLVPLGMFTFQSTDSGTSGIIAYGAMDQTAANGASAANQGQATGPSAASAAPEPGTLILVGSGLLLVGLSRRLKRN
jgi:hypothetical protein